MRITVRRETITPAKAAKMLKKNPFNRHIRMARVMYLAAMMLAKEWEFNNATLGFDGEDNLIDGQHRLMACIHANVSFDTFVVRGLAKKAFNSIDDVGARNNADRLDALGEKKYSPLSQAISFLLGEKRDELGVTTRTKITPNQQERTLKAHPKLRSCVDKIREYKVQKFLPAGFATFLYYRAGKTDAALADKFFESLGNGENLKISDPAMKLRETIIAKKASKRRKTTPIEYRALAIKAWNAAVNKKRLNQLRWRDDESFPEIL